MMAGSIDMLIDDDGKFSMDLIENMGDAHEALIEAHQVLAVLAQRWGGERIVADLFKRAGFPELKRMPVIQPELHGAESFWRVDDSNA